MKNSLLASLLCFFISIPVFSQDESRYEAQIEAALELFDAQQFGAAANKFESAFKTLGGKAYPDNRYNAACAFALAENADRAFFHLYYLADKPITNYKNYEHIINDKDLTALHAYERWAQLIAKVQANKKAHDKNLYKPLVAKLDSIYHLDQDYRIEIDEISVKHGQDSDEMRMHGKKIHEVDSINLVAIKHILDQRGWLGADVIGSQGAQTLFLVIQHADLLTQLKYLPMLRKAVALGKAQAGSLALLEDRVALRQGNRQIYGSQIHTDKETGEPFVAPMIEPDYVNERRAKVGLDPIEEYVKHWNLTWDVAAHKALTKRLEAE